MSERYCAFYYLILFSRNSSFFLFVADIKLNCLLSTWFVSKQKSVNDMKKKIMCWKKRCQWLAFNALVHCIFMLLFVGAFECRIKYSNYSGWNIPKNVKYSNNEVATEKMAVAIYLKTVHCGRWRLIAI